MAKVASAQFEFRQFGGACALPPVAVSRHNDALRACRIGVDRYAHDYRFLVVAGPEGITMIQRMLIHLFAGGSLGARHG